MKSSLVLVRTLILVSVAALANAAVASITLKQIQVPVSKAAGTQIDFLFDSKIGKHQVRAEYINDIVQLILTDVAVYPARIQPVGDGMVSKVFAYQYAPKVVRARLSVKGKADALKDKIQWEAQGNLLSVKVGQVAQRVGVEEKSDKITVKNSKPTALIESSAPSAEDDISDEKKLERLLSDRPKAAPLVPIAKAPAVEEKKALGSGKSGPGLFGAAWKLLLVVVFFIACAFGFKKLLQSSSSGGPSQKKIMGAIARFAEKKLGKKTRLVEIISTHYLGPKKSISVAKIAGRTLVLGITNDSINLITDLGAQGASSDALDLVLGEDRAELERDVLGESPDRRGVGATQAGPALFSDVLTQENHAVPKAAPSAKPAASLGKIRSRLEGLKQL